MVKLSKAKSSAFNILMEKCGFCGATTRKQIEKVPLITTGKPKKSFLEEKKLLFENIDT